MTKVIFVTVCICIFSLCNCMIQEIKVPKELEECFERYAALTTVAQTVGESIHWFCVNQYVWKVSKQNHWVEANITTEGNSWLQNLLELDRLRNKRQSIRKRREYRMLTDEDRHKFHRAIQMLKADTSILPNKYDFIASLHESDAITTAAHGGPNFLGWHRVYLLIFENALREKVPDVTVPYWDSTLDAKMRNPMQSIVWSEQFMGNGDGIVRTGPFADWQTRSGPLTRNVGMTGQPFRKPIIQNILQRSFVGEITEPHALPQNNIEFHHSESHLWIDGQMGALATSSQDPVFFCHHSYVDHVWEVFREKQRMDGINPTTDYPMVVNNTMHHAEAPMGFANMRNIDSYKDQMIEGIYTYEPVPTCQPGEQHCGSPYIKCVTMGNYAECVSAERPLWFRRPNFNGQTMNQMGGNTADIQFGLNSRRRVKMNNGVENIPVMSVPVMSDNNRNMTISISVRRIPVSKFQKMMNMRRSMAMFGGMQRMVNSMMGNKMGNDGKSMLDNMKTVQSRSAHKPDVKQTMEGLVNEQWINMQRGFNIDGNPINRPFQNTFNVNGRSDSRQWAYIPVTIFYKRPPDFTGYQAFPVMDGKPLMKQDILSAASFKDLNSQLKSGNPAGYMNCHSGQQSAGAVFVKSNGINYIGQYKEYAVVDHRMPISVSTVFIGVKNPQRGMSDVMMSASDSCGRVCKPYCRVSGPQGEVSRPCSGIMRITSDFPKLYGENFGEAIMKAWNFGNDKHCPGLNVNTVYLSFYCNYDEAWPFPGKIKPPMQAFKQPLVQVQPIPKPQPMPVMPQPQHMPIQPPQMWVQQMQMQQRQRQMQMLQQQQMQQQLLQHQQRQMVQTPPMSFAVCNVGSGCIVRHPCGACSPRVMVKCESTCSMYGRCFGGKFLVQRCRDGGMFQRELGRCVPGTCPEEEQSPFATTGKSASEGD